MTFRLHTKPLTTAPTSRRAAITAKLPAKNASHSLCSKSRWSTTPAASLLIIACSILLVPSNHAAAQIRIQSTRDVTPTRLSAQPSVRSSTQNQVIKLKLGQAATPVAIREVKSRAASSIPTTTTSDATRETSGFPTIIVDRPTNPDSVLRPSLGDASGDIPTSQLESNLEIAPKMEEAVSTQSQPLAPAELPAIEFQPIQSQYSAPSESRINNFTTPAPQQFFQTSLLSQAPTAAGRDCGSPPCADAAKRLQATPLGSISLDISPAFKPNLTEKPDRIQEEVRQWKNRDGVPIATGRLADFRFQRVHIVDGAGAVTTIPIQELAEDDFCYVADVWGFPMHCRIDNQQFVARQWKAITLAWKASELHHHPLYFEDVELERYGHTLGQFAQPFKSGAHFFANVAVTPYNMALKDPKDLQYTLGYYRPGSTAPRLIPAIPLSTKAALWQAGAMVGGWALIP